MMKAVLLLCCVGVVVASTLRGKANPDKPNEAFSREPLPPGPLLGSIAKDTHRNFPYDAFSTTFKCDKGPCPGSKQTGCGCAKCPCEPAAPAPCANPTPCGCNTPCAKPMPVAGPETKTVGPKTGGNGDEVKPAMVPHGTLPSKFDPVKPCGGPAPCAVQAPSLIEEAATCPDCCPKPCQASCTCAALKPMPVAGPETKTVGPKTGGNGNEVKPAMVPNGKLPEKFEPVKPCGGPAPCAVQAPSLIEEAAAKEPMVVKAKTESVTIGDAPTPGKGETKTMTKPTEAGSFRTPHMVKRGEMESYLSGKPQGGLREAKPETPHVVESAEEKEEKAYQSRVAEARQQATEAAKEETITSFVPHVSN